MSIISCSSPRAFRAAGVIALAAVSSLVAAPVVPASDVPATARAAAVVDCPAPYPNFSDVSARNMTCRAANRAIKRGKITRTGNLRTRGFSCRVLSGGAYGGTVRCTSGARAFRYSWGD